MNLKIVMDTFKDTVASKYKLIQDEICKALEKADGAGIFQEEIWDREGGGGGCTRIMQNGNVIEKGGVNFSAVHGVLPQSVQKAFGVEQAEFFATGVSIVIHPKSPMVPIIHMNIRYFELDENTRWFGGGIDLTPHYVVEDDAKYFHTQIKAACDLFNHDFYPTFKKHADDYFFIKHRNETRGVGGIFYDRLKPENTDLSWGGILQFSEAVGRSFAPTYIEIINRNRDKQFTEIEKDWQYQRRSRYVEFNLVYDSGTKFGLETNGRIESILMSLPPQANWVYNYEPKEDSEEYKTLQLLKKDVDWING